MANFEPVFVFDANDRREREGIARYVEILNLVTKPERHVDGSVLAVVYESIVFVVSGLFRSERIYAAQVRKCCFSKRHVSIIGNASANGWCRIDRIPNCGSDACQQAHEKYWGDVSFGLHVQVLVRSGSKVSAEP